MSRGLTNQEISRVLGISSKTVKTHVEAVLRALDVSNRTEAVGLYRELESEHEPDSSALAQRFAKRPAIAVMPFANMGGDVGQEYFVDGLVEELITALSRLRWIPIISRHSSFRYKARQHRDLSAHVFGRDLGAAYIVTGSVRRADTEVQLQVEFLEAATGQIIWSNRMRCGIAQTVELQQELSRNIVGSMDRLLKRHLAERAATRRLNDLSAWEVALRAFSHLYRQLPDHNRHAETLFRTSLQMEPSALAHAGLADTYYQALLNQWTRDRKTTIERIGESSFAALNLDSDSDYAHMVQAVYLSLAGNVGGMQASCETCLVLNPSSVRAYDALGKVLALRGDADAGIPLLEEAIRLGPREPRLWSAYLGMAMAHFVAERYEEALLWGERALALNPANTTIIAGMATTYMQLDRKDEAREMAHRLASLRPSTGSSDFASLLAFAAPQVIARFARGLQAAGLGA